MRYINDRFEAEFRLYALEKGLEWDRDTAAAFKNSRLTAADHPARKLLLESNIGIGIDLFFGGGTYDQAKFASIGYAVDAGVKERLRIVLPYLLVGLLPFAWYCLTVNHSYVHYYFTCRALCVSVLALLAGLAELCRAEREASAAQK